METLPDNPSLYFQMTPEAQMVPVAQLVVTKVDQPQSVQEATRRMGLAAKGQMPKRAPLTVRKAPNGALEVVDGNATATVAKQLGWGQIPVIFEKQQVVAGMNWFIQMKLASPVARALETLSPVSPSSAFIQPYADYASASGLANASKDYLRRILNCALQMGGLKAKNANIIVNVKSEKSFMSKLEGRAKKRKPSEITDVLRSTVAVENGEDIVQYVKNLQKLAVTYELQPLNSPQDSLGYFGSVAMKIFVPTNPSSNACKDAKRLCGGGGGQCMLAEVLVMTKKLYSYKDVGHDIYKKFRDVLDSGGMSPEERAALARESRDLYQKSNQTKEYDKRKSIMNLPPPIEHDFNYL